MKVFNTIDKEKTSSKVSKIYSKKANEETKQGGSRRKY